MRMLSREKHSAGIGSSSEAIASTVAPVPSALSRVSIAAASVAATPPSLPRMVRCRAFLKTLAQRRPDLSPDRIARIEALRDEEYGVNRSAEPLPADHPERVAADEALRRRRQAQIDALLPRPQQAQGNAPA